MRRTRDGEAERAAGAGQQGGTGRGWRMISHRIAGGGGLVLQVDEAGDPAGRPLVFLHGYSQCRLCWDPQFDGPLAERFRLVRMDLRGHGLSDKPRDVYGDGALWADDVAAVIDALGLDGAIVIAWSYGGLVVSDYLRRYGAGRLAGLAFVAAATKIGRDARRFLGPRYIALGRDLGATDVETAAATMAAFIGLCTARPRPEGELYRTLGYNLVVPPYVRDGLHDRRVDNDDLLAGLALPLLLIHGDADEVVLPAISDHHAGLVPHARRLTMPGIGHTPFLEDAPGFDAALAGFADEIAAR